MADNILPLLEPPGDFEAYYYYASFPSCPRLIGRTSSGTTPWWRLQLDKDDDIVFEARFWGPSAGLAEASSFGPVGPHKIRECWETSTSHRVREALQGLDWTSIDVLRHGRSEVPPSELPIIVWVGVSPAPKDSGKDQDKSTGEEGSAQKDGGQWPKWPKHDWNLIAAKLRAVRVALDADGLTDVECEFRESNARPLMGRASADGGNSSSSNDNGSNKADTGNTESDKRGDHDTISDSFSIHMNLSQAEDTTAPGDANAQGVIEPADVPTTSPAPRLRLPTPVSQRNLYHQLVDYAHTISATVGQSICPVGRPDTLGTLGLYLGPADNHATGDGDDADKPVWALTCHHVAFPPKRDGQDNMDDRAKEETQAEPPNTDTSIVLPVRPHLEYAVKLTRRIRNRHFQEYNERPEVFDTPGNRHRLEFCDKLLADLECHFAASDEARSIGRVHLSPPISSSEAGNDADNTSRHSPPFTLDWALVSLRREVFPDGYDILSTIDCGKQWEFGDYFRKYPKYFPRRRASQMRECDERACYKNDIMPLRNKIVSLEELQGVCQPPRDEDGADDCSEIGDCSSDLNLDTEGTNGARPAMVVMKRGAATGMSAGVALDILSLVRHTETTQMRAADGTEKETENEIVRHELGIVDLRAHDRHAMTGVASVGPFSRPGDSGAIVFDLDGRICGIVTSGSRMSISDDEYNQRCPCDVTYATPMAVLLPAIEREVGIPLRVL